MTRSELQERRIETIENFISTCTQNSKPPTIEQIIEHLDSEGLFEELYSYANIEEKELLEKKKNVFRNILKTHSNIKCDKAGVPTYYLTKQKRLSDKAKRLKSTLGNFIISEPLFLTTPIPIDFISNSCSEPMQFSGIYFKHKESRSAESIKYHLNTLIYRLEMNFKANAVFTKLTYVDIQVIGSEYCRIIFSTKDAAIDCYKRLIEIMSDSEEGIAGEDS